MTNKAKRNEDTVEPLVRRRFLSDYGAAWIGEGIAFAGLCIGLGIARAESMWALVIVWAFCMGPSKNLRDKSNAQISGGAPSAESDCSALVKACERTIKYLREIGELTRGESTFPSAEYADAMADDLEHAMKPNGKDDPR